MQAQLPLPSHMPIPSFIWMKQVAMHCAVQASGSQLPPPEHVPPEHVWPEGQSAFVQHWLAQTQADPLFM